MSNDVSAKVRRLRALKGWTQEDLAKEIPVSWRTVQRWEKGGPVRGLAAQQKLDALLQEAGIDGAGQ